MAAQENHLGPQLPDRLVAAKTGTEARRAANAGPQAFRAPVGLGKRKQAGLVGGPGQVPVQPGNQDARLANAPQVADRQSKHRVQPAQTVAGPQAYGKTHKSSSHNAF